ncbi:RDD family protein [Cohaesibacter celericrescens]|uniref:RDD domain-containing protein n=1 Tax=Cohaesibacter celericrescens TaxID=2067669 RepID=A0A2N5XQC4_9HYPH|nr:RDD family protein [Cohaesibacter celericrescens]PLW76650.1 hypothetical protein C0081_13690 [Cohaesibacter celericrescens]
MSFCTECGTRLPQNAKFCPSCGAVIQASEDAQSNDQAEVSPRKAEVLESSVEQAPEYIGLGRRFVAHLFDLVIVFIIFYAVGMQVAGEVGSITEEGFVLEGTPALVTMLLSFAFSLVYFVLTEGRNGQSFGKMVMGIKVVSIDGSPCTMRQAFTRNFLRIIDGVFLYLIGIILMSRSEKKQRLGDRIAETVVIRKARKPAKGSYVYRSGDKPDPDPDPDPDQDGKLKFRSSWGIKKGKDAWDI